MSRSLVLLLPVLAACNSGKIDAPDDGGTTDDTGEPAVVADDTGDTGEEEEEEVAEPEPDFSVWEGSRRFVYDSQWDDYDCDEEIFETGAEITSGADHAQLSEMCPACDHFYEISLSTDELCGYLPVDQSPYRGLALGDDWAQVFRFGEDRRGDLEMEELDLGASFDGWTVSYAYTAGLGWGGDIEITGSVVFPEREP
jgi:hypothetical protein